jgi:hypothetical protein
MDGIAKYADVVEIIELDDRLDTAFDPITLWLAVDNITIGNGQCHNSVAGCCCPPPKS